MEFFLPQDNLDRVPPEETKILSLQARPYEDARRVLVNIEMSPFEKRPHLEVTLRDAQGQELSAASFIEPMNWNLEFTLHLRREPAQGELILEARLFYPDGPAAEPVVARFALPEVDSSIP
ncbi:MAG: hypothetical protein ACOYYU_09795 [Chloroflexota bacterium]